MPGKENNGGALFAVVLAAGAATRFGSTKQLAIFEGEPLVKRATRLAESSCGRRTVLVCGADWQRVFEACGPLAGFMVRNDQHAGGLSTSIAAGVRAVAEGAQAVLLLLADQPLITSARLERLIDRWKDSPEAIVASRYAGIAGPPVIFPSRFFSDLASLQGDAGARRIIDANESAVKLVAMEDAAVDVDRPNDLERLL